MGYGNEFDHKFKMATVWNECQYIVSSIDMNISNHKMKLIAENQLNVKDETKNEEKLVSLNCAFFFFFFFV
jgi:hypothetical protein